MLRACGLVVGVCVFGSTAGAQTVPTTKGYPPPPPTAAYPPPPGIGPTPVDSPQPIPAAQPPPRVRVVSLTATPLPIASEILNLHPYLSFVPSVSLEVRAHPTVGIAVTGLAGDDTSTTTGGPRDHSRFWMIGAEPRFYPTGNFCGPMVGAALHYFRLHMTLDLDPSRPNTDVLPFYFSGYSYGFFAGYKFVSRHGFTVEAKGGVVRRTLTDAGDPDEHEGLLLVDARIGWSF